MPFFFLFLCLSDFTFDIFYTYSIHRKSKRVRERKTSFPIFTIFCVSLLGILSKSSNSILKNGLLLKRVCFFLLIFLLKNFYYYFYSSVYFIFKEKEMSLNDYIFLFCLFFHLPPKKSNSDCHLFCVSLMQNKWETRVARQNDVLLLWSVPHMVKKLKISFRWKKKKLPTILFFFNCPTVPPSCCISIFIMPRWLVRDSLLLCHLFPPSRSSLFLPNNSFTVNKKKKQTNNQIDKKGGKNVSILGSEMYVSIVLCVQWRFYTFWSAGQEKKKTSKNWILSSRSLANPSTIIVVWFPSLVFASSK